MIDQLKRYITSHQLFEPTNVLIIGVSGGVDSMVMLDLMRQLTEDWNLTLVVAHFNYKLRGQEADLDEDLVRSYCETHGLNFECTSADTLAISNSNKLGIQETARRLRYSWFDELQKKYNADRIILAHHSDDNLETVIYHLAKGTGIAGLRGMKPKNSQEVVRPFLALTKEQIIEYARAHQIIWREDESNKKTDYTRNLIRLKILPVLKQINPSLSEHFDETHSRLLGLEQLVEFELDRLRKKYFSENSNGEVWMTDWVTPDEKSLMLLSELLKTYGFNFRDTQDVFEAILKPKGQLFYSNDYKLNIHANELIIELITEDFEEAPMPILEGEKKVIYGNYTYRFENKTVDEIHITPDRNVAFLDRDKIQFPLMMRKWKPGDRMQPYGMHGRKKISDILIDDKVSNLQKDRTHVLTYNDEILWLSGVRVSHVARVTNETEYVLVVTRH